jgi:hypothetical protein
MFQLSKHYTVQMGGSKLCFKYLSTLPFKFIIGSKNPKKKVKTIFDRDNASLG